MEERLAACTAAPACYDGCVPTVAAKANDELFRAFERKALKDTGRRKAARPDMKAFAERIAARLKKQYGNRVMPDSAELMEYLRSDASCPSGDVR